MNLIINMKKMKKYNKTNKLVKLYLSFKKLKSKCNNYNKKYNNKI